MHRRHLQVVVAVVVVVVVVVVDIEVVVVLLWYYLAPKLQHSTCLKSLKSLFLQLKLQKWDLNPSLF